MVVVRFGVKVDAGRSAREWSPGNVVGGFPERAAVLAPMTMVRVGKSRVEKIRAGVTRLLTALALCLAASSACAASEEHWTRAIAEPLLLLMFFSPFLLIGLGVAAVVRLGVHVHRPDDTPTPLWPLIALVICAMPISMFMAEGTWTLLTFWPVILAVILLWHRFERGKGNPGLRRVTWIGKGVTLAALALLAWQSGGALIEAVRIAQVTYAPPGPGVPAFARQYDGTRYARPLTADYRLALARFPDPAACLQPGADPATADGLALMDWDRITTKEEAEVCIFRLLASYPNGMADFTAFAEAQGFGISDKHFNPANPYVELDGTLRVTGYWSLRHKGPKFPTRGLLTRILHAVPYGMDVNATYTPDGKRLLHVEVGFLTL